MRIERFFLAKSPFIRLLIPFCVGIVAALFLPLNFREYGLAVLLLLPMTGLLAVTHVVVKIDRRHWFGLCLLPVMALFGFCLTRSQQDVRFPYHLSHHSGDAFVGKVLHRVEEKNRVFKTVLELNSRIDSMGQHAVKGKLLVYLEKEPARPGLLEPGHYILLKALPTSIPGPMNPGQFNYQRYMSFHGVHHQVYLPSSKWTVVCDSLSDWRNTLFHLRNRLVERLESYGWNRDVLAVVSALVIGQKQFLDDELSRAYASAGAMHVLAVSGLHVGIIFLVIGYLLKMLGKTPSHRALRVIITLVLLWTYAAITGFSPSVIRATTMFSFLTLAKAGKRSMNIYNNLAASAFFLLVLNPFLLMEVGFQLSYLAVLGIVYLQPGIYSLLYVRNFLLDKIWALTAVSIAAQVATFPLGLLYFHQFPNYFMVSNLLVIPSATLILYAGLSLLILQGTFIAPYLAIVLQHHVGWMNRILQLIESMPYSLLSGISISTPEALLIYFILLLFLMFMAHPGRWKLYILALAVVVFMGLQSAQGFHQNQQQKLLVFNIRGSTAVNVIHGRQHLFIGSEELYHHESQMLFHVKNAWYSHGLGPEVYANVIEPARVFLTPAVQWNPPWLQAGNELFLLCLPDHELHTHPPDRSFGVVLSGYKQPDLAYLKTIGAEKVIADGNNPPYKVAQWKVACDTLGLVFYHTGSEGAYVIDW